jgi:hypothetical protein
MVYIEVYINRQLPELISAVESDPRYTNLPHLQDLVKNLNRALVDFNGDLFETSSDEEAE